MKKIIFTFLMGCGLQSFAIASASPQFPWQDGKSLHFYTQIERIKETERREFQYFSIETAKGDGKSAFYLGIYYKDGCNNVVSSDKAKAKELFQQAHMSGDLSKEQETLCQQYLQELESITSSTLRTKKKQIA